MIVDTGRAREAALVAVVMVSAVATACGDGDAATAGPGAPRLARAGAITASVAADDGLPIVYDVRGSGGTALVFVHDWAASREFWREQLDVFAHDRRVVALDLAGHGESGTGRLDWTVSGLAGDVVAVVDALDLRRVVLIGHGMGGPVALEAARRLGPHVVGVVGVDTLHDVERAPSGEVDESTVERFAADFPGTMERLVTRMFPADADPTLVRWVAEREMATPPGPALALFRDFAHVDQAALLDAVDVPVRCINAAPDSPVGSPTAVETNRRHGDFDAVLLDDVGHDPMLEKPVAFNAALSRVLDEIDPR